jgi:hypothetical protein
MSESITRFTDLDQSVNLSMADPTEFLDANTIEEIIRVPV